MSLFFGGNYLFIRSYYNAYLEYKASILPGKNENVTASVANPTNIAINKYIDEDRKKAAAEFVKFVVSKETQKKYLINYFSFSAITELYDDEEVCSLIQCEVFKNALPFQFMNNDEKLFGDDTYHVKYRGNLFDYLYNDKPLDEALKEIDDVTRIYKFTRDKNDDNSKAGLIIFILFLVLSVCMILSLIFIFIKNIYESYFKFLPKCLWIITVLGSLIIMSSLITLYGDLNNSKCQIRGAFINVGYVLSICPSLYKLITNFPENNKYSKWVEKNKYTFVLIVTIVAGGLNGILAISSYDLEKKTSADGKTYQKCIMNESFGKIIYYIMIFYNIFITLTSLFLIFIEWNINVTSLDIKFLATALSMDILSLILLNFIDKFNFKDYIIYNVLMSITMMIFSVFNYLFTYLIRILSLLFKSNSESDMIKSMGKLKNMNSNYATKTSFSVNNSIASSNNSSKVEVIMSKIMYYHNQTELPLK